MTLRRWWNDELVRFLNRNWFRWHFWYTWKPGYCGIRDAWLRRHRFRWPRKTPDFQGDLSDEEYVRLHEEGDPGEEDGS